MKHWSHLHTTLYKDFVPSDIYYVPFRRRVTTGWLEWLKSTRRGERNIPSLETDAVFTNYCIFANENSPYFSSVQATQFSPYQLKNHPFLCTPNKKSFSKRKLRAIIQHKKQYYQGTVPKYDDLIPKYDKYDDPILHPLLPLTQIYGTETEYSDDDECTLPDKHFQHIHNYYIPYKQNKNSHLSEINLNIIIET